MKLWVTALLLCWSLQSLGSNPHHVRVCLTDTELFPLWQGPGKESSDSPGINIDLHQAIAAELNFTIEWVRAPFARCLVLLGQNEVDMFNLASYRPEREKYGLYPTTGAVVDTQRRLKSDSYHAFVLQGSGISWDGSTFSGLANLPVGIEIGASIRNFLNDEGIAVYEVSHARQAFDMLAKKRVAAVITNQFNGLKNNHENIIELAPEVQGRAYYIMISREFYAANRDLAEAVWDYSAIVRAKHYKHRLAFYSREESWPH